PSGPPKGALAPPSLLPPDDSTIALDDPPTTIAPAPLVAPPAPVDEPTSVPDVSEPEPLPPEAETQLSVPAVVDIPAAPPQLLSSPQPLRPPLTCLLRLRPSWWRSRLKRPSRSSHHL